MVGLPSAEVARARRRPLRVLRQPLPAHAPPSRATRGCLATAGEADGRGVGCAPRPISGL